MPRSKPVYTKKRFHSNQHSPAAAVRVSPTKCKTASAKKLKIEEPKAGKKVIETGNKIIDLSVLNMALQNILVCNVCKIGSITLSENIASRKGICIHINVNCSECGDISKFWSSKKLNDNSYEINTRFVYAMRAIGKGKIPSEKFCSVMDLPPPPQKFSLFYSKIFNALESVTQNSMMLSAQEAKEIAGSDIAISLDGSCLKERTPINERNCICYFSRYRKDCRCRNIVKALPSMQKWKRT